MLKFSKYEKRRIRGDIFMKRFVPKMYQKSIYTINYAKLKKRGVRCLLFDLDNTCVGYHEKNPTKELEILFKKLQKMGFLVILFSNASRKRLVPFERLGVLCHPFSKKPLQGNFRKILRENGLLSNEVCMIGDQLFTDICGGNQAGVVTCLVDPVTEVDFIATRLFRALEGFIYRKMRKGNILNKGEYYE